MINDEGIKYKGYTVNLAAGLETVLIEVFSPDWNLQSKKLRVPFNEPNLKSSCKSPGGSKQSNISEEPFCEITLHKSYYGKSFFNIPIRHSGYLSSDDKSAIEITLGNNPLKILAVCDRTAADNKSPRIRIGKEFALWTTNNFI